MSTKNDGGPAFPSSNTPETGYYAEGMTLRDYFAIRATEGDIEAHKSCGTITVQEQDWQGNWMNFEKALYRTREQARYAFADAMLKAREEQP